MLALQEWLWRDWYGVWTRIGGIGDFGHGTGEGVLQGVVRLNGEGVVGGVRGVCCME